MLLGYMARMGAYEAYAHSNWAHSVPACDCCAFKQSRRGTGLYVFPIPMEVLTHDYDFDCETDDVDDCYQHLLAAIQRRRRGRRWVEEKEFKPHHAYSHFAYSRRACEQVRESPPRRGKKGSSRDEEIEYCLHSLADRLEALEINLEELTRVRSPSGSTFKSRIRTKNAPTKKHSSSSRGLFKTSTPCSHSHNPQQEICQGSFRQVELGLEAEALKSPTSSRSSDINVEPNPQQRKCHGPRNAEMNPEVAARIIQSRFRAYLVRRSQSLRHLRDLAMVKSEFKQLNFLFTNAGYRRIVRRDQDERRRFCEKAVALLLKLDSIEGTDFMIREARRSLSKKVVALLDSVEDLEDHDNMDGVQDASKNTGRAPRGHWQPKRPPPSIMDEPVRVCDDSCESCTGQQQSLSHCYPGDFITDANNDEEEDGDIIIEGLGDWRSQVTGRGPSFNATCHPMSKKQWRPNEFNMPTSAYTNKSNCSGPRRKFGLPQRDLDDR